MKVSKGLVENRLDFTDYASDPVLEDEYFGGFRPTKKGFSARSRLDGRYCCEFSRSGRGPKGWAAETGWGLVDGQTPATYDFLRAHDHWPKWRKLSPQRATGNQVDFAFVHQAVRLAEQKLPVVNPERDAAEDLERWARHQEWLASLGITDPTDRPFTPSGIVHQERATFYAQHTERRVQALFLRQYKPSKKLELKRFPTLKRIAANPLLTESYLARESAEVRATKRPEAEAAIAAFLAAGGQVQRCPPEMTAARAVKLKPKRRRKPGRKPIGPVAMTTTERVRKHRRQKRLQALVTPERRQAGAVPLSPLELAAPANVLMKGNE
jgi:hypothetical protein